MCSWCPSVGRYVTARADSAFAVFLPAESVGASCDMPHAICLMREAIWRLCLLRAGGSASYEGGGRGDASVTVIPRRTVPDVLATLEAEFGPFVVGFCGAKYVLWIGSGVSREVVPGVSDLLKRVLEFVRSRMDSTDPNCPYGKALDEILDIGSVPATIRGTLDYTTPIDTWSDLSDILGRLEKHDAEVLNVQVGAHDPDYLVFAGRVLDDPVDRGVLADDDLSHCVSL